MEIPDDLLCLFTGRIEERDDDYAIEVPATEVRDGDLEADSVYRIALFPTSSPDSTPAETTTGSETGDREQLEPPIDEGDIRTVEIEGIGDQGDGIARVERGYVVIVPDTEIGEEVEVEIESCHPNFAMAEVVDRTPNALD